MAPSRRKGARKAAAAAAACRQWNVGDLVLAKVKGFPPWPATVSEPEKWGYFTDWKKVLVYFYGTQQIAFCNPVDVEAFTKEKKQSLVKRQGKGADFVRAVEEIIDSYEKLKRETQVDETNSGGEVANANVSNLVDSPANLVLKDQMDAPLTHNSPMKCSNSVTNRHELVCSAEDDSAAALRDESHNKEASLEEPTDKAAATVKSLFPVTYSSRRRSEDLHPQDYVTQKNAPVRWSRSSSWVQNFVMPSDGGNNAGKISANADQNVSVIRNKHISKSPDHVDSSAFASNSSVEDNGSEILTIDSDAFSLNEVSTIDSNFRLEHSETIECPEGEVELTKVLDLEISAVVNKKKGKPDRERITNDAAKPNIGVEEAGVQNAGQSSQNIYENSKERFSEQDGDEHLPLLKRARVRVTGAELNSIVQAEDKRCKEDVINSPQLIITSPNCENGSPADGDSSTLNRASGNVSPSKISAMCSGSWSLVCKIKKDQTFGSFVDGEAALPPSKRLHRALQAMSTNAAEEGQACMETSSSIITSSARCCISVNERCPFTNNQGGNDLELQGPDNGGISSFNTCVYSFSTNSIQQLQ